MKYNFNGKIINIPEEELNQLMSTLDLTEQQAIETWLDDNDYTTNEEVEMLSKKAKENKTDKIVATDKTKENRGRKAGTIIKNATKREIIEQISGFLYDLPNIYGVFIENECKIITFNCKGKQYKLDLIEKRDKKV